MKEDVASAFLTRTVDWPSKLAVDEWFFERLRSSLVDELTPSQAFDAITDIAQMISELDDPDLRYEAAVVLVRLARQSDTSEMPPLLKSEWFNVSAVLSSRQAALLQELRAWYRVSEK